MSLLEDLSCLAPLIGQTCQCGTVVFWWKIILNDRRIKVWIQRFNDRPALVLQWIDGETGARKSRSAGTADPAEAEKVRADLEYELNHGLHHDTTKMSWERFRELYEREKLAGTAERTQEKGHHVFDTFERLMRPGAIGRINERTLSQYSARIRERGSQPSTIKGHLAYLRAALRWAAEQKIIPAAPKVKMPKVPKNTHRAKIQAAARITQEEFERLLMKAPNDGWRVLLGLAWYAGLRRGEARNVRGEDVQLDAHRIALPENKAGDEAQTAIITPELDAFLRQWWPDGEFPEGKLILDADVTPDENTLSKQFRRIARKAAVRGSAKHGLCMHDLRRNFGSRFAAKYPAQVLQRMMRHASIKTTLDYYADVEKAALELLWPGPAKQTARPDGNVTVHVTDGHRGEFAAEVE